MGQNQLSNQNGVASKWDILVPGHHCQQLYSGSSSFSLVTAEQMQQAVLPLTCRDYCAHEYIRLLRCRRENFPNYWACNEEKHAWQKCGFDEYVMRMKEFEREKRLKMRKQRIEMARSAA
uniref:NADH dehydrogenase [ubiquinone] 1 beta subcomplex subunit 7 n=1 Tax=Eptatretus burgeri TaxID=7764 RepID=A0A8C4NGA8_EPTBU